MMNKKYGLVLLSAALLVNVSIMGAAAETDLEMPKELQQLCSVSDVLERLEKVEMRAGYSSEARVKAQKSLHNILGYRVHFADPNADDRGCPGSSWCYVYNDLLSRCDWFLKKDVVQFRHDFSWSPRGGDGFGLYIVTANSGAEQDGKISALRETRLYTNYVERTFAKRGQGWQEMYPSRKRLRS